MRLMDVSRDRLRPVTCESGGFARHRTETRLSSGFHYPEAKYVTAAVTAARTTAATTGTVPAFTTTAPTPNVVATKVATTTKAEKKSFFVVVNRPSSEE